MFARLFGNASHSYVSHTVGGGTDVAVGACADCVECEDDGPQPVLTASNPPNMKERMNRVASELIQGCLPSETDPQRRDMMIPPLHNDDVMPCAILH
jgi:hypothetical protein